LSKPLDKSKKIKNVKTPENKKLARLELRVSISEKSALSAQAKDFNLSLSDFVRASLGKVRSWSVEDVAHKKAMTREIAKIGNNLNQIARHLNSSSSKDFDVLIQLSEIKAELRKLNA